jgi:hypothetical protein
VEWSYFDVDENIAAVSGPNPINSMLHALRCIMNVAIINGVMAFTLLVAGCGKKNDLPGSNSITPKAPANAASIPVAQPALIAWKQGDKAAAVNKFVEADWSARPLFVAGSVLNLGEDQFKAFSDAERKARVVEMTEQLDVLKQLAKAVAQAGRDEALKGDLPQARMYFASLKQCGTALGSPDRLELVQMVGQSFRNLSDKETANIGK